jgi:ribosomal protein S18 acetylase RimI-like enzyme
MTTPAIVILQLTKSVLAQYLADFIELEHLIVAELGTAYDKHPWGVREFELELPSKWDSSWCAVDCAKDKAVGFLVTSRFGDNLHGHRMIVHTDYRRHSIARRFHNHHFAKAQAAGLDYYTAQVPYDNHRTRDWYINLGFELLKDDTLNWYLNARESTDKNMGDHLVSPEGLSWVFRCAIQGFTPSPEVLVDFNAGTT